MKIVQYPSALATAPISPRICLICKWKTNIFNQKKKREITKIMNVWERERYLHGTASIQSKAFRAHVFHVYEFCDKNFGFTKIFENLSVFAIKTSSFLAAASLLPTGMELRLEFVYQQFFFKNKIKFGNWKKQIKNTKLFIGYYFESKVFLRGKQREKWELTRLPATTGEDVEVSRINEIENDGVKRTLSL